jgi:2-amino-4-hydroxy-6-hydroxymethyldihydropteridine diphosphokinase
MREENIYLLLGSNLGDRVVNLTDCLEKISLFAKIIKQSSIYETAAWGNTEQPNYLNLAIQIESRLSAKDLLQLCLEAERKIGRIRNGKWEARIIDVDIIYYGNEIIHTNDLIVPHPRIAERRFVLEPLCELSKDFIHPIAKKTNQQLLNECTDPLLVTKLTN